MNSSLYRLAFLVPVLAFVGAACGGSSGSGFGDDEQKSGTSGDGTGSGSLGNLTSGGTSGDGASGGAGCVAKSTDAERLPANLFFVVDQSASMAWPPPYDLDAPATEKAKRWDPMIAAFKAFVQDPQSQGIHAAMELFPTRGDNRCSADAYANRVGELDVGMTALPNAGAAAFAAKLPATPTGYATPTRAVLRAVAPLAKSWAESHPDAKTAIVLLTDGLPDRCGEDDDIDRVAGEVAAVANVVPTYVIGVSNDPNNLANLRTIAQKGNTVEATLIDTSDPAATQRRFLETINAIRGRTLSCDVPIPAAPAGTTFDLQKVNVTFTTGAGARQGLDFDEGCKANGWRFDSPQTPRKIVLCAASCDAYKADPKGVVAVEFGCERRVTGVK